MLAGELDHDAWAPALLVDKVPGVEPLAARAEALGMPVRRLAPMPLGLAGAGAGVRFAGQLRHERPAIFHAHLSWPLAAKWGLAAAVAARLPSVATVQLIPDFHLDRSSYWQLRAIASGVDRYIAVSGDVEGELIERFRWPAEKIDVVYNAVQVDRFGGGAPEWLRRELSGESDRQIVFSAARLDPQKGHPTLLQAAVELPQAVFVLAGDGPERGRLESMASDLEISERVRFLGHRSDVPELLAACDVFALPSLYEGSSLAVLEAMAAGRPVVSSAIGGTDELIDDGIDGVLVPPGDAIALTAALRRLLGDAGLRSRLAERARRRVQRDFTPAAMASRVESIYEEVLASAGRSPR